MPHTGTDIEDEGSDPGSDRNEEGRKQGLEYTDLEDRGYDVEITDTEASEGLLYEEVATLLSKSAQRKERRQELLEQKKEDTSLPFLFFIIWGYIYFSFPAQINSQTFTLYFFAAESKN